MFRLGDPMFTQPESTPTKYFSEMIKVLSPIVSWAIFGLICGSGQANGQVRPQTISGGPTCESCSIERHFLATVQDSTYDDGAIVRTIVLHVNSDGSFLVNAGPGLGSELYLAGRNGAIVRRVGRTGEGPGEYKLPMRLTEADSLFLVLDLSLRRATYLRKPSLELLYTVPIPGGLSPGPTVAFPDGSYVMWARGGTRSTAGHALHHVSGDGRILRSFGPPLGEDVPTLALAGDGGVWIGFDDYRIEKWSVDGDSMAAFVRVADWVKPIDDSTESGDRHTMLTGLREDENGLIWVHNAVRTKAEVGGVSDPAAAESVIEVLDPSTLTVVAQSKTAGRREWVVGGRGFYLGEPRTSPSGLILMDVWRFRLLRQSVVGLVRFGRPLGFSAKFKETVRWL